MRIALVADLHGNWPATQALEKDLGMQKADRVFCLGDMVGKGPSSDRTLDWAMANCDLVLGGNWDYGIGNRLFPKDAFYWEQLCKDLGEKRMEILRALPREHFLTLSGRSIRLFHGRPVMDDLITIRDEAQMIQPFFTGEDGARYDVVGYADAHRQALRTMTLGLFFNCGSVGNALGEPRCCYALMEGDPEEAAGFEIRFRSVDYDREAAVRDAKATPEIPHIDSFIKEIQTGVYSR